MPTVTLAGTSHRSRVGASLLTAAGLPELIATTPDDYVACAARLAADLDALSALRGGLRDRMAASSLLDGRGTAAQLETAYHAAWLEGRA